MSQTMKVFVKDGSFGGKACRSSKTQAPAASLKRCTLGLGLPVHIEVQFILTNVSFILINLVITPKLNNTLLVLNRSIILPLILSLLGDCYLLWYQPYQNRSLLYQTICRRPCWQHSGALIRMVTDSSMLTS